VIQLAGSGGGRGIRGGGRGCLASGSGYPQSAAVGLGLLDRIGPCPGPADAAAPHTPRALEPPPWSERADASAWPRQVTPVLVAELGTHLHSVDDPRVVVALDCPDLEIDAVGIRSHEQRDAATRWVCPDVMVEDVASPSLADSMFGCGVGESNGHRFILGYYVTHNSQFQGERPTQLQLEASNQTTFRNKCRRQRRRSHGSTRCGPRSAPVACSRRLNQNTSPTRPHFTHLSLLPVVIHIRTHVVKHQIVQDVALRS